MSGGMMILKAWGRITYRMACRKLSPHALEASSWVLGMEKMPDRISSAIKAEVYTVREMTPAANSKSRAYSHLLTSSGRIASEPKYQKKIWTSSGVFRKNSV